MRPSLLSALAAIAVAAMGAACERRLPEPHAALPMVAAPRAALEATGERPEGDRTSERRGDRHARAEARRPPVVKRIEGTVARADRRHVAIRRPGAAPLALRLAPGTRVTVDGRPAGIEALREGTEVRASYRTGGGRPTALSVEARTPAAPPAGAGPAGDPAGPNWGTSDERPPPSDG